MTTTTQPQTTSTAPTGVSIQRGSILVYRVFDAAEEIDLRMVEQILSKQLGESRMRLSRGGKGSVIIRNAPVVVNLGDAELEIGSQRFHAEVSAKIWDYGALSISLQIPIPRGTTWQQLNQLSGVINGDICPEKHIDPLARRKAAELSALLKPAFKKPNDWAVFEDYVIYFLEELSGIGPALELVEKADIPAVLLGESQDQLAAKARAGILENVYQYATNDLVVIDWNSAVLVEPTGSRDIADVIEFTLSHLLEVRYYDDLLDRRLGELYDAVEQRRSSVWKSNYGRLAKEASSRYMEFSEFMERVDNSLKVVGDYYLAVIFRAAARRFRIPDWQESITRKMNMMARVSELLQTEVNAWRSHLLELVVIFLIAFEIFSAVFRGTLGKG